MKHSIGQLTFCENRREEKSTANLIKPTEEKRERVASLTVTYRWESTSSFKHLAIHWATGGAQENPHYATGYRILLLRHLKECLKPWFIQKKGAYRKGRPPSCPIAFSGETWGVPAYSQCLFSDGISGDTGCRSAQWRLRLPAQPLACGSCHSASPERAEASS